MKFIQFMAGEKGRQLRVLIGAVLVVVAMVNWGDLAQLYLAIFGGVLIAAGTLDFCLLAPFFNLPMSGKKIRSLK